MYFDFYNQKLKKKNECSFLIGSTSNKPIMPNIYNNNKYIFSDQTKYGTKKYFSNYNGAILNNIVFGYLGYNIFEYTVNNKDKFSNIFTKIMIPINAIKKMSLITVYPLFKEIILEVLDTFEKSLMDKFLYIPYLILTILLFILIFMAKKKRQ